MGLIEWTALLGNVGEFLGSLAVMVTLVILVVQVRDSARAVEESNRLQRSAAIDRHSDMVGSWRSQVALDPDMTQAWLDARNDQPLDAVARLRVNFMWINFVNLQRSNFVRAHTVNEPGLARQAALAVAAEATSSATFRAEWQQIRPWNALASAEYARSVDAAIDEYQRGSNLEYGIGGQFGEPPNTAST
jgi:hypothetical protein